MRKYTFLEHLLLTPEKISEEIHRLENILDDLELKDESYLDYDNDEFLENYGLQAYLYRYGNLKRDMEAEKALLKFELLNKL